MTSSEIFKESFYGQPESNEWGGLMSVSKENLDSDSERSQLALYLALGNQKNGSLEKTRDLAEYAIKCGADKNQVARVLLAGVYDLIASLLVASDKPKAIDLYAKSATISGVSGDPLIIARKRYSEQSEVVEKKIAKKRELFESSGARGWGDGSVKHDENPSLSANEKVTAKAMPGDAKIDGFMADISPFFFGRSITYVDVGAYVGEVFLKIHECKLLKIREAHLFEPNPESFGILRENIKSVSIPSLHAYNFAVGSEDEEKIFSSARSMTKSVGDNISESTSTNTFSTECHSLDRVSVMFTDRQIDILKIDVEGGELDVLKNAHGLLVSHSVNVIYIEVGFNKKGSQQTYFGEIEALMQNYGYRVFKIYEQTNEWISDSPLLRRCNVAYMSQRFAEANPMKATQEIAKLKKEILHLKSLVK